MFGYFNGKTNLMTFNSADGQNWERLLAKEGLAPLEGPSLRFPLKGVELVSLPALAETDEVDIPCTEVSDPFDLVAAMQLTGEVEGILGTLTQREQDLLKQRFGMDGAGPRTLEEVGRTFDLTRQEVRQIEARSLMKLRRRMF